MKTKKVHEEEIDVEPVAEPVLDAEVQPEPVFPDSFAYGVPEPAAPVVKIDPLLPEAPVEPIKADWVVDAKWAQWLLTDLNRPMGSCQTVAFLGQGIRQSQLAHAGSLAYQAVKRDGTLFVPQSLEDLPCFVGLPKEVVEGTGYIAIKKTF